MKRVAYQHSVNYMYIHSQSDTSLHHLSSTKTGACCATDSISSFSSKLSTVVCNHSGALGLALARHIMSTLDSEQA